MTTDLNALRPRRKPQMSRSEPTESFLALLRAAEEGEVEETMAEVIARFETSEDGDGDEAVSYTHLTLPTKA